MVDPSVLSPQYPPVLNFSLVHIGHDKSVLDLLESASRRLFKKLEGSILSLLHFAAGHPSLEMALSFPLFSSSLSSGRPAWMARQFFPFEKEVSGPSTLRREGEGFGPILWLTFLGWRTAVQNRGHSQRHDRRLKTSAPPPRIEVSFVAGNTGGGKGKWLFPQTR